MKTVVEKRELWLQAMEQLRNAVGELDQAHATLKDLGYDREFPARRQLVEFAGQRVIYVRHPLHIEDLVESAMGLLGAVQTAECDECGHEIKAHHPKYGCEHERGDVLINEALVATGPCGCTEWRS